MGTICTSRRQPVIFPLCTGLCALLLTVGACAAGGEGGGIVPTLENKVKAAILVKLTKFVDWPAEQLTPGADISICLRGGTPLAEALRNIGEQKSREHSVKPVYLESETAGIMRERCKLLYLSQQEASQLMPLLDSVRNRAILTVSDIPDFAVRGGMVELVRSSNHLAFRINLKSAKRGGLSINSQLLGLATLVD